MFNPTRRLTIDTKAQDRLREWFAQRGLSSNVQLTCVSLGDSDVDYELSDQSQVIRVLNSPYNVEQIKHKLVFSGSDSGVTGQIQVFARYIDDQGNVLSTYNSPPNQSFLPGALPPTLSNGVDVSSITFNGVTPVKEGFVLYFQTLPDNFVDGNGVALRLVEPYDITFENLPILNITKTFGNIPPAVVISTANSGPHGLSNGDQVVIKDVATIPEANGIRYALPINPILFRLYYDAATTIPVPPNGVTDVGTGTVGQWEVIEDVTNGSMLIGKLDSDLAGFSDGKIKLRGLLSGIEHEVSFNY